MTAIYICLGAIILLLIVIIYALTVVYESIDDIYVELRRRRP